MRYLGLDLGSRTLGCALSDKSGIFARSYTIIRHNEEYDRLIKDVYDIVTSEKVEAIVLGYPKNMNNTVGPKGELSLSFKKKLEEEIGLPVFLQDERLTTKQGQVQYHQKKLSLTFLRISSYQEIQTEIYHQYQHYKRYQEPFYHYRVFFQK